MAKRTRVTRTAPARPGSRPASTKTSAAARREPVVPRPISAPLAPAQPMPSIVEAAALVETQPRSATQVGISRSLPGRIKVKPNSLLAARASTEYVYVGRDLRRIVIVGAAMFGTLILLWILLVVLGLSGLY